MLAKINSSALMGIDAYVVTIETDITEMLPSFTIVGLPDSAVKESRERVLSAIKNCKYEFPSRKVTVNMAPAGIKKEGASFDLPIALGLLVASKQVVSCDILQECIIIGELSLDGNVKKCSGILSIALNAKKEGIKKLIIPEENKMEAAIVDDIDIYPVKTLMDAVNIIEGNIPEPFSTDINEIFQKGREYSIDFSEIKGQEHVKRAVLVAAAGGHNILMVGPPGSGKTMIAKRIPTILPTLSIEEALETTKIHSVAGLLEPETPLLSIRPFRSPHHTISDAGLTGGGSYPRPGEISLSHNGVLFLDELPEFNKNVLENLRQPLEEGKVTISRAAISLTYPAKFMLAAALNPCPCGYYTDQRHECCCTPNQIQRYMSRISGPLLDRIDIHIEVPALTYEELSAMEPGESSDSMRKKVENARNIQLERFKNIKGVYSNAMMAPGHIRKWAVPDRESQSLLKTAVNKLGLSARAYDRILKVARTIADLEHCNTIRTNHIAEAVQYRSLDRKLWMPV